MSVHFSWISLRVIGFIYLFPSVVMSFFQSFSRSFVGSFFQSVVLSIGRLVVRSFNQSVALLIGPSFFRLVVRSPIARSVGRSFSRSLVQPSFF